MDHFVLTERQDAVWLVVGGCFAMAPFGTSPGASPARVGESKRYPVSPDAVDSDGRERAGPDPAPQSEHQPVQVAVMRGVDVSGGICQHGSVHDLAGAGEEHAEQGCLAGGQVHQVAVDPHAVPRHVEGEAVGLDHVVLGGNRGPAIGVAACSTR
jgi:hypothetical protein